MSPTPHALSGPERAEPHPAAPSSSPEHHTFTFQELPIRVLMLDGIPWIAAADACRALKLEVGGKLTPARYLTFLDSRLDHHRAFHVLPTTSGPQRCAIISANAAFWLTQARKRRIDQQFRTALRNEIGALLPQPDRTPFKDRPLALQPDGSLPPQPRYNSARYFDWLSFSCKHPYAPKGPREQDIIWELREKANTEPFPSPRDVKEAERQDAFFAMLKKAGETAPPLPELSPRNAHVAI